LIYQSAETASIGAAATAGGNVPTTFGKETEIIEDSNAFICLLLN
jgi:hypothetical protein